MIPALVISVELSPLFQSITHKATVVNIDVHSIKGGNACARRSRSQCAL